ncbi:MAG TPA: DNA-binding response regulator [Ruminococcaceae bacterium]|nr:DNA-binding response regulator [Oscillospiraceae bacterium]
MSYNVLVVEDQRMPRKLLELYIRESDRYYHVGSVSNADSSLPFCDRNKVDLILMDVLTEFGSNGLDASEKIKAKYPNIKIIILTSMPEAGWLARAKRIGVDSFWYKETDTDSILNIMDCTMAGEHIFPDTTPVVQIGSTTNHEFTEREIVILRELLTGDSNSEIAKRLDISIETVKFHITQMLQKTGFHSRTELATKARSLGIVIK